MFFEISFLLMNYHSYQFLIQWYSLEPEIEKNAKRRVYWNHSVGWLRMHEFILNQQGDMFETFIMHVKKILETNPELQLKHLQNLKMKALQDAKKRERDNLKNLLNIQITPAP